MKVISERDWGDLSMSKKYRLGDLCNISSSKRIFESEYVANGVPFIRGLEITDGSILNPNAEFDCYISEQRYSELKERYGVPQSGDILITAVGTIGNLCFLTHTREFYFKDGNVLWFNNFDEKVYSKYLYYFMESPYFKKQLECSMIGAVQKALTIVMLQEIEIELPDYNTQVKIAETLACIDDKIKNNNKINSELEALAKTIYDYCFVQFDFPNEEGKPYKSSGGKMVWNDELKREIPEGWKVNQLDEICEIRLGGTPSTKKDSYWNGGINWLNSGEVAISPVVTSEKTITEEGRDNSATSSANIGDIVMSITRYIRPSILGIEACYNQSVVAIIQNSNYRMAFLYPFMLSQVDRYMSLRTGAQQPHINKEIVGNTLVCVPCTEIMEKYYGVVNNLYEKQILLAKENLELASLRDFLLPLLMNGQVTFK